MKTPMTKGAKTLEEWIELYEKRTGHKYLLTEREQVFYSPEIGFFTYWFDHDKKWVLVPKMCGDGQKMRDIMLEVMTEFRKHGFYHVYACSRVRPPVYIRANKCRGFDISLYDVEFIKEEEEKGAPLYYYLWTWKVGEGIEKV